MFRRFASSAVATTGRRGYYAKGPMEEGISGTSMHRVLYAAYLAVPFCTLVVYKLVWHRNSPIQQWPYPHGDLYNDDGTEMQGEEALAMKRIQRERMMPFMDDIERQLRNVQK
jgi:hypothetical protein